MPFNRTGANSESRLLRMPESEMGFQIIRYREEYVAVFNTILIIPLNELRKQIFTQDDYLFLSGNTESSAISQLEILDMLDDFYLVFSLFDPKYRNTKTKLALSEATISSPDCVISSKRPYSYYRLSAFYKNKQVVNDGSYLTNRYATTYNDFHFAPSNFAAVGRYAIPNPASAQYVFPILIFDRSTLMGTATPNLDKHAVELKFFLKVVHKIK